MPPRIRRELAALVTALMLLGACGGDEAKPVSGSTPPPTQSPYTGYPSSIVALGHSQLTGVHSDPQRPTETVRANSWATGANPVVDSLYLKILAKNPAIKDHAFNYAKTGAVVADLRGQALTAASLEPKPDLVVILIGDNDIVCPATQESNDGFLTTFSSALDVLADRAPTARIFVFSLIGSPTTYAKILSTSERKTIGGTGPCHYLDSEGRVVPAKLSLREKAIHDLEAQLEAGCSRIAACRYDGGAFGTIVEKREDFAPTDIAHLSIAGHAKAAAVAWDALKRAGYIPDGTSAAQGSSIAGRYNCLQPGASEPDLIEMRADGTLVITQGGRAGPEGRWSAQGNAGSFNPGTPDEEKFTVQDGRLVFEDTTTCTKT